MMKTKLNTDRLLALMQERGLSRRGLSDLAGASESYIKDLLNGKTASPSVEKFIRIVDALGVYPNELIPIEWRRQGELNEELLALAIEDAMDLLEEKDRTPEKLAHMINTRYMRREKRKQQS